MSGGLEPSRQLLKSTKFAEAAEANNKMIRALKDISERLKLKALPKRTEIFTAVREGFITIYEAYQELSNLRELWLY